MARPSRVIASAWLIHAVAWFAPVHKYGVRLPQGLPGWQAFRIAFSPIWPYEGSEVGPWYGAVLTSSSALTNLVIIASVPIILKGSQRARTALACVALVASLVNAQWVVDKDWMDLRLGYYLWWLSFVVLGAGLFRMNRDERHRD